MQYKHSGLGIASFVMSILGSLAMLVVFAIAGFAESSTPGGMDENSPIAAVIGLGIIGLGMFLLMAFVLGVVALFQRDRNIVFGIIGTAMSGCVIFGTIVLIAIGMTMA